MAGRKETVSDAEILRIFYRCSDPFLTTSEVAEQLEFSLEGARKRLYALEEDGYLEYKKVGNSPAFWLTEQGEHWMSTSTEDSGQ